ncbi:MAG: SurA N-terminal domain-containing protein [Gemmatimonadales bacterium]|nr:MAG: SurA N-terminal domain-containing protein [Gemmatimonadales bacterium]
MMRQMRENTKWIMLVTALAFVALMVFEWGMDMSGQSAGSVGEIGRVNGTPIYYETYQATYRNLYDQIQSSQGDLAITSQQVKEIEDAAFEEVVNQILIQQELERRGIVVSSDELRAAAQFNPPPEFATEPAFQTDGQFDFQRYQQFLATADELFLLSLEAYYRDIIPRSKLLRQVSAGVYLSDQQLWQRFRDQNETVEVRYIPMDPAQRIPNDAVELTDREIQDYYDANQTDFEQPARAQVQVVVLDKTPTATDTVASRERAQELLVRIDEGEGFADLAEAESSDEISGAAGGDLGVFGRNQMLPAFDSAVFGAPVGQVVGPVQTPAGFHLIEVQERWAQDSARARHILIPVARTEDSEIVLFTMADSLEDLGEVMPLEEAAAQLGLAVESAELTDAFAFVSGAGQVSEGADWAFEEAEVGEVSPVFETAQAFYALELVSTTPGGVLPLASARPTIEQILYFQKKQARAEEEAAGVLAQILGGEPLPNAAAGAGLEVRSAGPFARNDFVPGLGRYNAAVGTAFGLDIGEVSDVVSTPSNTFLIELISRTPADSTQWLAQKDAQRAQVTQLLQQERLEDWLDGLRDNARVVDRRDIVLRPADEQPGGPTSPFGFGF